MMPVQKALLTGSPDDIRKKLDELSHGLALNEYPAGARLRALGMKLAECADLKVSVITYHDESQELEVALSGDPHCDAIVIGRDKLGFNCHVTWERWLEIREDSGTEKAATLITDILKMCAHQNGDAGDN